VSASATTTTPSALRSDDGTILDRAAWARGLLLPRRQRRRGGQGKKRQQQDPRRPREQRRTQRRKCASRNGCQSAGLHQARVPAPVGRGGWRNNATATATDDDGNNSGVVKERCRTGGSLTRPGGRSTRPPVVAYRHRRTGSG
jgi:hypothetical protein